jgi:Putative DNA-binding domain
VTRLRDLQRRFRDALLTDSDTPVPSDIVGGAVAARARLGVYRNNVIGNLTQALRLSYPAVERLVGEEFFALAARRFVVTSPARAADLGRYGDVFADFLASFEAAASMPYLVDVARLECAVNRALNAPAAPMLVPNTLSKVPAERQADLRFKAHPTLSLVLLAYPARAIWQAVLSPDADERAARLNAIDLHCGGEALAVLRGDCGLDVAVLSAEAFALARVLANSCALGEALGSVAPEDAASSLAECLTRGLFSEAFLVERTSP